MYIKKIKLKNFRNYEYLDIDFKSGAHIISGMNAQGKSNFIEAIYYSAFSRSFRNSKDIEMIKDGERDFFIELHFSSEKRDEKIEINFDKGQGKRIRINEIPIKKISDFIGKLKIACFTPEDLYLISGSPNQRRRFIDRELSQIYPVYLKNIIDYNNILSQRNAAIKQYKINYKNIELINMWDDGLSSLAENIIKKRLKHIDKINTYSSFLHNEISNKKEILKVTYDSILNSQKSEKYGTIKSDIKKQLEDSISTDIKYGYTTIGPHKDDFDIYINGKEAKKYASQGQKKLASLSIKLSQIEIIKEVTGVTPVVLLDDVSSELDEQRRLFLLDYIKDFQAFMTTTDVEIFKNKKNDFNNIVVENGVLKEAFLAKRK